MATNALSEAIPPKDVYGHLIATRNFEIGLFWQRSNYFLGLNSGLAVGYFTLDNPLYQLVLAALGLLASTLWLAVCLGSKFWQTRWEARLAEFEQEHFPALGLFAADALRIHRDVETGFDLAQVKGMKRMIYGLTLSSKPSVSYSMIRLAMLFVIGWAVLGVAFIVEHVD